MSGSPATAALLRAVLEAEHAAVFGYGVLGARLTGPALALARLAVDGHRARRDQVAALLGAGAPVSAPAYDVAVDDEAAALALAVRLEDGLAVRWRDLVATTPAGDDGTRSLAVAGLQESAVRAAQWRREAGDAPLTLALPGAD